MKKEEWSLIDIRKAFVEGAKWWSEETYNRMITSVGIGKAALEAYIRYSKDKEN